MIGLNSLLRYKIRRKISSGGMATVFLAHDLHLNRDVALKMLHPHLLNHKESVKRFSVEAKAIAALSHENIIQIYDYGQSKQRPFIVMEFIDGKSLQEILDKNPILPNSITIALAVQILNGIQCAHLNGIYHRDIKPSNILINKKGIVRITDFGIAYLANAESITTTGSLLGSPNFISPEQATGKSLTCATDIFSFGILLYLCSTGKLPFTADSPHATINAIVNKAFENSSDVNKSVLFWLSEIIDTCLIKNPQKRATTAALLQIFKEKCTLDLIITGPVQIERFLSSPATFALEEHSMLFQNYRKLAFIEKQENKHALVLRRIEQARRFGNLSIEDLHLLKNKRNVFAYLTIISICIIIIIYVVPILVQRKHNILKQPSNSITSIRPILIEPNKVLNTKIADTLSDKSIKLNFLKTHKRTPLAFKIQPILNNKSASTAEHIDSILNDSGCLSIYTNPPWVVIFIDGAEIGITPQLRTITLSKGNHLLKMMKNGYKIYETSIIIVPSDTLVIRTRL